MKHLLRCCRAFVWRDIAMGLSYRTATGLSLLSTIGRVLVMWLPAQLLSDSRLYGTEGGFLGYAIVGTSMMSVFLASYGGFAGAIRGEQAMGTLEAILMTPASTTAVVVGSNLWGICYAILDAALMLTTGAAVFGLTFKGSWLDAAIVVLLTNLSFASVGILSAAFAVVFKRGDPFRVLVSAASFLLGGVIYPVDVLPTWVQRFSFLLPITHGARALRGILLQGQPLANFSSELAVLGIFALIGIPASISLFGLAVRQSKRDGSLLQY